MKKKTLLFMLFIIFALLYAGYYIDTKIIKSFTASTASACTIVEEVDENAIISDWIMKKSYRISRKTANGIVDTAMSTDCGLLLIAIASRESSFSPTAVSKKGAIGLNQIMPGVWVETLKEQGIIEERKDLFDYDKSLLASEYILTYYYKQTGSWQLALKKYVGGHHKSYTKDVFATYGELQLLLED